MNSKKESKGSAATQAASRVAAKRTATTRSLYRSVKQAALHLADKCDFASIDRIRNAEAACVCNRAIVCVTIHDIIDRAQAIAAFSYGAVLNNMALSCLPSEDVRATSTSWIITITLIAPEGK